jgi:hypothetical protein
MAYEDRIQRMVRRPKSADRKRDSGTFGNFRNAVKDYRRRKAVEVNDRKNYGAGIMAARAANNPNIDSEGYNREVLNRLYGPAFLGYNEDPNRRSQLAINTIMDFDQRDPNTPVDTRELGDYTTALNALNDARLNKRFINDMYLPDEDNLYQYLPEIAYAIDAPGMVRGQDLPMPESGMPVRAGDLYGDPTYPGNYGTMTPSSMYQGTDIANPEDVYRMGRGNPYLQDLSYTMAGPSTNYFSEELDEDGNVKGYSMNTAADGTEFVDPGYNIKDIPTERRFEETLRNLQEPEYIDEIKTYEVDPMQGKDPEFMPIPLAQPDDSQGAFLGDVGYSNDPYYELGTGIVYDSPFGGTTYNTGGMDAGDILRPVEKRQFPDQMTGTFGLPFELFQDPTADGGVFDYFGRKIQGDEIDEENYEPYQEPTLEEKRRRFMENYG